MDFADAQESLTHRERIRFALYLLSQTTRLLTVISEDKDLEQQQRSLRELKEQFTTMCSGIYSEFDSFRQQMSDHDHNVSRK